ncbi:MAG TPA: hypothetical protein VHB50_21950, partial [Bryobacteraceae bacterium]|nr:hypothetical protein [Bryobacteraceae bacterium]
RITRGTGAGQERTIRTNDGTTITIDQPWLTAPDASSFFAISESSWRSGAKGSTSPIPMTVPERLGATVQLSARAANVADSEAEYALSPLTRWTIGQSGGLAADADTPPAPLFGVAVSPARGGVLDLSAVAFADLANTRSITSGTFRFHYFDEVNGPAPIALGAAVAENSGSAQFGGAVTAGTLLQIDQEIVLAGTTDGGGNTILQRGLHSTTPAGHTLTAVAYPLKEKVAIVPFVKNFFGSPSSGDWKYSLELSCVRIASAELYLTNALGDGAISVLALTNTIDSGLRTLGGGQFSFQISGYLAIQTGAAPDIIVDADRCVRDVYAVLRTPSAGAGVTLQINLNGLPYTTVQFDPGAITSGVINGFGLPSLHAGDQLSLDVAGVGTTNPGSDLTLIMRL